MPILFFSKAKFLCFQISKITKIFLKCLIHREIKIVERWRLLAILMPFLRSSTLIISPHTKGEPLKLELSYEGCYTKVPTYLKIKRGRLCPKVCEYV